jgi:hypothetical protein
VEMGMSLKNDGGGGRKICADVGAGGVQH